MYIRCTGAPKSRTSYPFQSRRNTCRRSFPTAVHRKNRDADAPTPYSATPVREFTVAVGIVRTVKSGSQCQRLSRRWQTSRGSGGIYGRADSTVLRILFVVVKVASTRLTHRNSIHSRATVCPSFKTRPEKHRATRDAPAFEFSRNTVFASPYALICRRIEVALARALRKTE